MDGQYPDDLNKKSEAPTGAPAPGFASARPPEDEDLYLPPSQRAKPKWRQSAGKALKISAVILLVGVIAGGVYWKFFHNKNSPAKSPAQTQQQTVKSSNTYTDKTKEIASTNVGLTLAYPESWNASDEAGKLTISSPVTSLAGTDGQKMDGKIVLTIQPKGTTPEVFDKGGVIAALDSQKIKYAKPTEIQRAETYVSFLQYTEKLVKGQLDGLFVTGDFGYKTNQFVPKTDIAKLDPLISVTFQKCDDDACANPTDASVQPDMWTNDADFQKTIMTMLKSIQVNE